jgi:hypothetical protein
VLGDNPRLRPGQELNILPRTVHITVAGWRYVTVSKFFGSGDIINIPETI